MLRFAVCDDDTMQLEQLQRLLCDYFQSRPDEPVQIEAFHSGEALLENPYDGFCPPVAWRPMTKFEKKGLDKDYRINELWFVRR